MILYRDNRLKLGWFLRLKGDSAYLSHSYTRLTAPLKDAVGYTSFKGYGSKEELEGKIELFAIKHNKINVAL